VDQQKSLLGRIELLETLVQNLQDCHKRDYENIAELQETVDLPRCDRDDEDPVPEDADAYIEQEHHYYAICCLPDPKARQNPNNKNTRRPPLWLSYEGEDQAEFVWTGFDNGKGPTSQDAIYDVIVSFEAKHEAESSLRSWNASNIINRPKGYLVPKVEEIHP
jgi:hypothetical protein